MSVRSICKAVLITQTRAEQLLISINLSPYRITDINTLPLLNLLDYRQYPTYSIYFYKTLPISFLFLGIIPHARQPNSLLDAGIPDCLRHMGRQQAYQHGNCPIVLYINGRATLQSLLLSKLASHNQLRELS